MYLNLRLFHGTPKCTALLIIFLKHRHVQGIPISSHLWQIAPGRWPLVANDPVGQGGRGAVVPVGNKNCWVVLLWWSSAQFLATWLRENWKSNFPIFDGYPPENYHRSGKTMRNDMYTVLVGKWSTNGGCCIWIYFYKILWVLAMWGPQDS